MKKLLIAAAAATVLFASCKKDKTTTTTNASSNTWILAGTTYSANSITTNGPSVLALNSTNNGMTENTVEFTFAGNNLPTTGGTYTIVNDANDANEVSINLASLNLTTQAATNYSPNGNDGKTCTVTVNNGKVTVVVPQIMVVNDGTGTDSTTFSANITTP